MADESLKERMKGVSGQQRKYLLLRIADIEPAVAKSISGLKEGTYNTWLGDKDHSAKFKELHQQIPDLIRDYKDEAVLLLRRENQLAAVLMEAEIIDMCRVEIITGQHKVLKTNLAREVYSKLMSDLDPQPLKLAGGVNWTEYINNYQLVQNNGGNGHGEALRLGEAVDGQFTETGSEPTELEESQLLPQGQSASPSD